jgi:hypothetical protein
MIARLENGPSFALRAHSTTTSPRVPGMVAGVPIPIRMLSLLVDATFSPRCFRLHCSAGISGGVCGNILCIGKPARQYQRPARAACFGPSPCRASAKSGLSVDATMAGWQRNIVTSVAGSQQSAIPPCDRGILPASLVRQIALANAPQWDIIVGGLAARVGDGSGIHHWQSALRATHAGQRDLA